MPIAAATPKVIVLTFTNAAAREFRKRMDEPVMMSWLNQSQWNAVQSNMEQIVVMSGPGSGKTRTAIARVQRFGGASFVGTLHAYCFRLLKLYGYYAGFTKNVAIISEQDGIALFEETRARLGLKADDPRVLQDYLFTLKYNNIVDYDRVLSYGRLLLDFEEVRKAETCEHLIVEEAQDSAEIDWSIYFRIPAANRFFIGDVDQAIFEFREAFPQGLLNVAMQPASIVLTLEENYRCGAEICKSANNLIKHNKSRYAKDTVPCNDIEGVVSVAKFDNPMDEVNSVSREIARDIHAKHSSAVLCRTRYEVVQIRNHLSIYFPNVYTPLDRPQPPPDWRRAMILLGLWVSPYNELLAEQFFRLDNDAATVANWKLQVQSIGYGLAERLSMPPVRDSENWQRWMRVLGVSEPTVSIIEARMRELPEDATMGDLLHELSSATVSDQQPEGSIFVGTMHSAKGREFDVVYLPGMEDHSWLAKLTDFEEERRLVYVALTRARRAVLISWCARRQPRWGDVIECKPSRFISEMFGGTTERKADGTAVSS